MKSWPPDMPDNVRHVIGSYPLKAQKKALELSELIMHVAKDDARIGTLTETLKWNEPAYLTEGSKSGTTVRYAWKEKAPDKIGVFFNCKTTLISTFSDLFGDLLELDSNRAIWLSLEQPLAKDILKLCFQQALTYKLKDSQ